MSRSYISVSEGVTACNSLALCGCSPSAFAPSDNPDFTGTVCAPIFSATTCVKTPAIMITTGAGAGCVLQSDGSGNASWATPSGGVVWTGSTNNGIGTYSSSGTICSEPNLTFNGSALAFAVGATRYICFGSAGSDTLCVYGATNNTTKGGDIKIEAGEGFTTTGGSVCIIAGQGDVYGKVSLFQNYVERLATTTSGICVTGTLCATTCTVTPTLKVGSGSGSVTCTGSDMIVSISGGDLCLDAQGCVSLSYSGTKMLCTVSNGICLGTNCGFAVDWIATSDCRLKTDIRPIINALSVVGQLCGVSYKLCDDFENENRIGLIAQDVLSILPEIVSHSQPSENDIKYGITDEKLGIKYDKLTAILIEAIKEQNVKINNLELEIERIKTC